MPRWPKKKQREGMDEYGRTPLWNTAFSGDIDGVRRELASGIDPNKGDDAGYTPLHAAIQERRIEIVQLLLISGANPNKSDNYGNVPLWTAVQNSRGDDQIILQLLQAGADPRIENKYGRCPFEVIAKKKGEIGRIMAERYLNNDQSKIQNAANAEK
jgi:ankyrin repeat protein